LAVSLNFAAVNVLSVIVKLGFYVANATHATTQSARESGSHSGSQ